MKKLEIMMRIPGWRHSTLCNNKILHGYFGSVTQNHRLRVIGDLLNTQPGTLPPIGTTAYVIHTFTIKDTTLFAELTGDSNPLHSDNQYLQNHTDFQAPIVQGLLSGGLFATIFGKSIPGSLYVSQKLTWRSPLFVDEEIRASIQVIRHREQFVICKTICETTGNIAKDSTYKEMKSAPRMIVDGEAIVRIPTDTA